MAGRYAQCEHLVARGPGGLSVRYLATRTLPQAPPASDRLTARVRADERDRLDLLAYRTLGQALLAYRIADANVAMSPLELCRQPGATLTLPPAQG